MKNQNKRKYARPCIVTHPIDNEISLVMMTGEGDPPDPPRGAAAQEENPFESNPFEEKQ